MTKLSDRILSQQEHMDRVRAVQRRSAYERVLNKIATLQAWARKTKSGMTEYPDGTAFEAMTENEREQLAHLIELRDMIRAELVEHGQIEA